MAQAGEARVERFLIADQAPRERVVAVDGAGESGQGAAAADTYDRGVRHGGGVCGDDMVRELGDG
ncbi:hypothetical protein [Streptomyces rapamycinicus]|uniref:Uncharacterized protein n=1 Tax=Streptomyces rapamycinicus TaxID=1226757 RepID=A0ABR6LCY6_9ACTN|nr:hypothetical protein [Streptomyces rapamycinicus]MBB4779642.1 hypothetical protein [Streptomyces rapamycinicus]UTP28391.1 hypothetical protein LIV37_02900 [Streptomyces rapamycinicus NRRL 5491]